MKIGILQAGHSPEELKPSHGTYGDLYPRLLAGHGFDFEIFSVVDSVFPNSVRQADGWLITGSKHGAYEDHAWIPPLEDFIRDTYADGRPLIGVCFGHQIIAQALGGKVEKFAGGWAVGRTEYRIGDQTFALNAWHQDQVVEIPEGARVIGISDFCRNAALVYDTRIWTIQPHPEFEPSFIDGLITYRGAGVVPPHQLQAARDALSAPVHNRDIAAQMAAFFKQDRKERA